MRVIGSDLGLGVTTDITFKGDTEEVLNPDQKPPTQYTYCEMHESFTMANFCYQCWQQQEKARQVGVAH